MTLDTGQPPANVCTSTLASPIIGVPCALSPPESCTAESHRLLPPSFIKPISTSIFDGRLDLSQSAGPGVVANEIVHTAALIERRIRMDKDRVKGSARQTKGAVKEVVGKVIGDAKLEAEGKSDRIAGKVQNAVGGLKDVLRGK